MAVACLCNRHIAQVCQRGRVQLLQQVHALLHAPCSRAPFRARQTGKPTCNRDGTQTALAYSMTHVSGCSEQDAIDYGSGLVHH
jgi:hypothetical protein